MNVERDWYGLDWRALRSQLVKLCLLHAGDLLDVLLIRSGELHEPVHHFLALVSNVVNTMATSDRSGLWKNCLPLLIQADHLIKEFDGDRAALCGAKTVGGQTIAPSQALARKLILFFEMNRREHVANELGVSSNKVKTWERLDRISRKVIPDGRFLKRCTEEHFAALAEFVKAHYPQDKNLPRRAITVKGYFYRFSADCVDRIEDRENTMEQLSLIEAKELLHGVGMDELSRCLQRLDAEDLAMIDASFGLGMAKVVYLSSEDYQRSRGLSRMQFEQRQAEVLGTLRQCLELGLAGRIGGMT